MMLVAAHFADPAAEAALSPLLSHVPGLPLRVNPIDGLVADQIREGSIRLGEPPAAEEAAAPAEEPPSRRSTR